MAMTQDMMQRATRAIEPWSNVLLLTHERPDGDALGSLIAVTELLERAGKRAAPFVFGIVPRRYASLLDGTPPPAWAALDVPTLCEEFDGLIVVDTSARGQLTPASALLDAAAMPTLVIDHHVTREGLGEYELVDVEASSTCLIITVVKANLALSLGSSSYINAEDLPGYFELDLNLSTRELYFFDSGETILSLRITNAIGHPHAEGGYRGWDIPAPGRMIFFRVIQEY